MVPGAEAGEETKGGNKLSLTLKTKAHTESKQAGKGSIRVPNGFRAGVRKEVLV